MKKSGEIRTNNRLRFPAWILKGALLVSVSPFLLKIVGIDIEFSGGVNDFPNPPSLNPKYSVAHALLVSSSFLFAAFTALLAFILFKIKGDLKIVAIGILILFSGCSEVVLSLISELFLMGEFPTFYLASLTWGLTRLSGICILITGIVLLIKQDTLGIRRVLIGIILAGLFFPLMSYGVVYYFIKGASETSALWNEAQLVSPLNIGVFLLYGVAGLWVFPTFYKIDRSYISHAFKIIMIPLAAAHLYIVFVSEVAFDHGFLSAYFLHFASSALLLSGFVMELANKSQENRRSSDVTKLKEEGKENLKLSRNLEFELDSVEEGLFGINNKGETTSINSTAQLILGYSENEFIGKLIWEVIESPMPGNKTDPREKHPIHLSLESGNEIERERSAFRRKDGTSFSGEYRCTPIKGDEKILGAVVTFTEIVERNNQDRYFYKALQEASKAREEAEQANQTKSNFLSIMSHEIRTPLSVILGYAEILQRTPSLPADQKECVSKIETSGNHLLELINDILDISKIEAGEIVLNSADFNLNELVNGLAMMFRNRCETKNLEFYMEGIDSQALYVNGDEGKIRQILVNLLGNAVKFTSHGKVGLKVEQNPENIFKFSVSDTGNGIALGDQKKIFEPFKQGKDGLNIGGTGLGLPISWELAELMGGTISIESEEGKGSTFILNVELKSAHKPVESRSNRSRTVKGISGATRLKALVVDDAQENRVMLCRILKSIGINVKEADNGDKALEVIREFNPNIIFMDKRMPGMNGDEVTRKIFEEYGPDQFRIVGVTASAFSHEREAMLNAGCAVVIGKPFRIEQIFNCIQTLLQVEYEYQDENKNRNGSSNKEQAVSTEFSSMQIPVKMFLDIKDSIDKEDPKGLIQELAQLSTLGEKGKLLETRLSTLVKEDDFEGIMELLEKIPVIGTMHD